MNYARMEGLDSEEALRKANKKFETRFKGMEEDAAKDGFDFKDLSLEQMLSYWQKQKNP